MMKRQTKCFLLVLSGFLLVSAHVFGQSGTSLSVDLQTVAIARYSKAENISVKQYKEYVQLLAYEKKMATQDPNAQLTNKEKRDALEELGNQVLANQAAEQEKITITDRDINQAFDQKIASISEGMAQYIGRKPTDAEIDTEIRNSLGMTRASYKELMKRTIIVQNYLMEKKKGLFESIKQPTEAEIQNIYDKVKSKSIFEDGYTKPDSVGIRILGVQYRDNNGKSAAQTSVNNLAREIGTDAAKFDSTHWNSKNSNTAYGAAEETLFNNEVFRRIYGSAIVDAAFRLNVGGVSRVLEGPNGFFIVRVVAIEKAKTLTLNDVYLSIPNPQNPNAVMSITVREVIGRKEVDQRSIDAMKRAQDELVKELRAKGSVQVMDNVYNSITW